MGILSLSEDLRCLLRIEQDFEFGYTVTKNYCFERYISRPSTSCWAVESEQHAAIAVTNECGDSLQTAQLSLTAGNGDECTITNSILFEGIPVMNRYGLAVLALLMLGVGMVATRRFAA